MHESHYNRVWEEIKNIGLGAEVIIAGFHGEDSIIVKLDEGGGVHWEDHYSVIGTGSQLALSFLCQNEYDDDMPLGECLYRVLEAKVAAHKNRTVGHLTYFEILIDGEEEECFGLTDACFDTLKSKLRFTEVPRVEIGDECLVPISEDDNEKKEEATESETVGPHAGIPRGRRRMHDEMPSELQAKIDEIKTREENKE